MTKRIVSGVFLLIALGALGLILAGALTSGEQLIVRFLTAIIVAALGLYVISDLRLQADDTAIANSATRAAAGSSARAIATEPPPPNSTAAFMATVTGKRSAITASLDDQPWAPESDERAESDSGNEHATQQSSVAVAARSPGGPDGSDEHLAEDTPIVDHSDPAGADTGVGGLVGLEGDEAPAAPTAPAGGVTLEADGDPSRALQTVPTLEAVESPYTQDAVEVGQWPLTPDGRAVAETQGDDDRDEANVDGLVAIFTKQAERKREARPALAVNGQRQPVLVGSDVTDGSSAFTLREVEPLPVEGELHALSAPASGPVAGATGTTDHRMAGTASASTTQEPTTGAQPAVSPTTPAAGALETAHPIAGPPAVPAGAGPETPTDRAAVPDGDDRAEAEAAVGLVAASYADARIIDLRLDGDGSDDIEAAIRSGELEVITSLIDQGLLSTAGPISDRDVRTMVYVAFTSNELRKILLAGGTLDADTSTLDLGPVEVFAHVDSTARRALGPAPLESDPPEPVDD